MVLKIKRTQLCSNLLILCVVDSRVYRFGVEFSTLDITLLTLFLVV